MSTPSLDAAHILGQTAAQEVTVLATIIIIGILVGWVLFIIFGARWIYRDAKRRGDNATLWVLLFVLLAVLGFGVLAGVVLIVYLLVRSPDVKYTDQGHLHVPRAPPPGIAAVPTPVPTMQSAPPPQPIPAGFGPPIALSRVKCPRCQGIFEYQRALQGPTHVKCPSCGEEGNI